VILFSGIDVQIKRGWLQHNIPEEFRKLFLTISGNQPENIVIGIGAPRMTLKNLRKRYYQKESNSWHTKEKRVIGRECEVIINSHRIANCQWTNTYENSPDRMKLGFEIFSELHQFPLVYEVFPSASYNILKNENLSFEMCLKGFKKGVQDMLDASVAALTVYEFINGGGTEIGGEDGLGIIVLPLKLI
jgi:hypothetical protein